MPTVSPSRSFLGCVKGKKKNRQRGIFSETVSSPMSDEEKLTSPVSDAIKRAPQVEKMKVQPLPSVNNFINTQKSLSLMTPLKSGNQEMKSTGPKYGNIASVNKDLYAEYPSSAYEPIVSLPFETLPGQPPRNIEIQRKKRLFSSHKIEDLLLAEGVDYRKPIDEETEPLHNLPLEAFDNNEWDVFPNPESWIKLGIKDGVQMGLPAKGLYRNVNGSGQWMDVKVCGYNSTLERFDVLWLSTKMKQQLKRTEILFVAEDPFRFAKRIGDAHKKRRDAYTTLRYNLYIDCMPSEGLPSLDTEQMNRVLASSLSTPTLRQTPLDTTSLLNEVNLSYARAMNKIILDLDKTTEILPPLEKPSYVSSLNTKSKAPKTGTIFIPDHNFAEEFSNFSFNTLCTKLPVINVLVKSRDESSKLLNMNIFKSKIAKSLRVEEFSNVQTKVLKDILLYLNDSWVASIKGHIQSELKTAGKGWFDLTESNTEVYNFSKLKKLFRVINFMMQDNLRFMVEKSIDRYVHRLIDLCQLSCIIINTNQVTVEWTGGGEASQKRQYKRSVRHPVFLTDIIVTGTDKQANFEYNIDINQFVELPITCLTKALEDLQNLPQVERLVMTNLFWSHKPTIATVHVNEVQPLIAKLRQALQLNIEPLRRYLATYDKHLEFLHLDEAAYISNFSESHEDSFTLSKELKSVVQSHINAANKMEGMIPATIDVGLACVNTLTIRNLLAAKHRNIAESLLNLIQEKNSEASVSLNKEYKSVMIRMDSQPSNIEELTDMDDFLSTISVLLKQNEAVARKILKNYEILEEFKYHLGYSDFSQRWNIVGWPKKILDRSDEVSEIMLQVKATFDDEMSKEQEVFVQHLKLLQQEVLDLKRFTNIEHVDQVSTYVRNIKEKLSKSVSDAQVFNSREGLFGKDATDYAEIVRIKKDFEPYCLLWEAVDDWLKSKKLWMEEAFTSLDADNIERVVENLNKDLNKASKYFERKQIDGCQSIAQDIKQQVVMFKPYCPLISALRNPGMKDRHWEQLSKQINTTIVPDEKFTLNKIIEMDIVKHIDKIIKVGEKAGKEFQIEKSLRGMKDAWLDFDMTISPHRDTGTYILKGVDDLMNQLDEQITMTQAMGFSAFKKPFAEEIESWDKTLALVSEVIDEWIKVQRNWLYLQPIFDAPDINKRLPVEGKRFTTVDKNWRQTLSRAKAHPKAIKFCDNRKLLEKFQESNKFLDLVQKGLSDYLETKRGAFCRFYFLSNDELLEILSQTKDPTRVQPHLKKCFEAIKSVDFQPDLTITAMNSSEGETIQFSNVIDPTKSDVEVWMNSVEKEMKNAVKRVMYDSITDYASIPRGEWMQKWPGMCVLNGSQVHWTTEMEAGMDTRGNAGLKECYDRQLSQLEVMVKLVRGELPKLARTSIGALAVIDVHAKDVTKKMVDDGVEDKNAFEWISQLRYYWEGGSDFNGDLWAMMVSSKRPYGYEYLGNSFRLVITPLTDKCYLTLMGALQMVLGGAPAGPAGTGKTETTKDLAKALAKQCIVFNCSDSMDYRMTGKFFKGLASCGAWACFDEFNRILIEVLSVIAQQIMTLQQSVLNNKPRILFEETEICVSDQFAVFITMNPGYAGRTELPDNLKALFRPVAMMVPDYGLIGEIMLFAYGFEQARLCARKMVATFRLCSEQLSSQDHYDYGMRAVKTVIVAAGNLKRQDPDMDEELLMLRGLIDVNLPKFLAHDLPLFRGIMSDLFPGKSKPEIDYGDLLKCIKLSCEKRGLQSVNYFVEKCVQLYEMIVVRHGLMVVGPTMGGKSENIYVLKEALTMLKKEDVMGERFEKVSIHYLNPKSIKYGQLYGEFDPNTHEWKDGIVATIIRQCSKSTTPDLKWVLFDGPVDTLWIESMNTVLDDNKKLCLNSGEIVALSNEMTMMFEPKDLSVASPATVSRCGMIYMEPHSLGYGVIIASWLERLPKCFTGEMKSVLLSHFDTYISGALAFLRRALKEPVPTVNNNLVWAMLNILDCYFAPFVEKEGFDPPSKQQVDTLKTSLPSLIIFAMTWSICVTGNHRGRKRWNSYIRSELDTHGFSNAFPEDGTIYDYLLEEDSLQWTKWTDISAEFVFDSKATFNEIVVPTKDITRYTYLLNILVTNNKNVLMTGPTGTGKTVNIENYLQKKVEDTYIPLIFTFSAQTSENQTQDIIDGKTEKRRKGVYGPPVGKKFVIFVDDVNMPEREIFFAQPPIELLRQLLCAGGWYDRSSLEWKSLIDMSLVLACGPPGGGRNPVSERFFRHFNILGYTEMEDDVMFKIFSSILCNFLMNFSEDVAEIGVKCVWSSIYVYNKILKELLPTPAKSHYTFNLRDLGKVFQGLLMCDKSRIKTVHEFARLWIHEELRVFSDRLINEDDKNWFKYTMKTQLENEWGVQWIDVCIGDEILFGDFMDPGADPRVYEEITDLSQLIPTVEEYLIDYNGDRKPVMNLVLFMNAVEHVSRISRIIRQPSGNALLLGVGGSGRQSLTRLATFMADYKLFQIEISKGYGPTEWREDLKQCLLSAGIDNKPTVFLFTDSQIVFEGQVENVNNVLNSGDVPNLYDPEDMDRILTACRPDCRAKGIQESKLNIFAQYILRVKFNIHVVICMSPLGEAFRRRLRMFPSLSNCCTIDWFTDWPKEALETVASSALTSESTDLQLGDSLHGIVDFFGLMHQNVAQSSKDYYEELRRYNYVTPTSYLEVLSTYQRVLTTKRKEIGTMRDRLQLGLDKMKTTEEQVAVLQDAIQKNKPVLERTQIEVNEMIEQINKDKEAAAVTKAEVEKVETDATEKARITKEIADDAKRDLDEALPALDQAVECLNRLEKGHFVEVRNFSHPPFNVKLTMEAVCIMFGVKPLRKPDPANVGKKINDYWDSAKKKVLNNPAQLLDDLKNFDRDNIAEATINKIQVYIDNPDFTPSVVEHSSTACSGMCMWVRAMYKYHNVAKEVEPKKIKLKEAEESLDITLAQLNAAKAELKQVNDRIDKLESNLSVEVKKKDDLEAEVELATNRLGRAEVLLGGLAGEKIRWSETVDKMGGALNSLIGDALISSGTIAYIGAFTPEFRSRLVNQWHEKLSQLNIPHTPKANIVSTLADPVAVRGWIISGLPTDNHSIENGIIMSEARRWPLFVDPQGQANRFIRNMGKDPAYAENGIDIIKLSDPNFLRILENGVRFGRWVLLENIEEELDAALEPLLQQQKFIQGGTEMIKIGDNTIAYNDSFKFFMTTKLSNPHYPPEVCVKVSLLNFTITPGGLEDQLLGVVIIEEMPELEEKKNGLIVQNAKSKKDLQDLETKILTLLSKSEGNILDDVNLIEALDEAKKTSDIINEKMAEAAVTENEIDDIREKYRPIAIRGSMLFFCISDLAIADPMYQYSLTWFKKLFTGSIRKADKSDEFQQRLSNLIDCFTYTLYVNVCRSLFEKHKLVFAFLMSIRIMQGNGLVDDLEWRFLLSGQTPPGGAEIKAPNPDSGWIVERTWKEVLLISSLKRFHGFDVDFGTYLSEWKSIFDKDEPQNEKFPGKWNDCDLLQKLCIMRILRPDKITEAMTKFVVENLGGKFVEPPPFDLTESFTDSQVSTPLIFVLTSGSDPTKTFIAFAKSLKMKFHSLSLGQGQDVIAERMIVEGMEKGMWVYLQNCHLYVSWMTELERICESINPEDVHKDFRLWLSSMPSKAFPVSILQNGVKMTMEPPKGLRANLKNAYYKLDDSQLNKTSKPKEYMKLLFALSFFHANVQDRRKYGALGWNRPYDFNATDLEISMSQVELFLDQYDEIPYKVLNILVSYINYGGRVTDYIDLRTIDVILKELFCPDIMKDDYNFSESGIYYSIAVNESSPHEGYMSYIESLPMNPHPEIFGMHGNANITCAQNETWGMFNTILALQPRSTTSGGKSREDTIYDLASSIEERLPKAFDIEAVGMRWPLKYEQSMNTVLVQECLRFNNLINAMWRTLPTLKKALKGLVVMSSELEDMANSLFNQWIPSAWESKAYPSLKPLGAWVEELLQRIRFISDWYETGIPSVFWISGFFFPQAFITGNLQNYARKYSLPIDAISNECKIIEQPWSALDSPPEDGCYVRGLFLEGARWDPEIGSLNDSQPKELFAECPVLHLMPVENRILPTNGVYRCPVYKILSRWGVLATTGHSSNFVMWIELPSNRKNFINNLGLADQDTWIKAGVAAFCSLRY